MKYETQRRIERKVGIAEKPSVTIKDESNSQFIGHCCPHDKLSCKRYNYEFGDFACFTYDVKGRLRFVCKRFVAPVGFSVPKRLTPEQMNGSGSGVVS